MHGRGLDRFLFATALLGVPLVAWLALVEAPSMAGREGFTAPLSWKLFFFHVPIAFVSFLAYAVALVASLAVLRTGGARWDRHAQAAVEVGVLYTGITLTTGMLWGKAEWGVPWRWSDAKLVLVLLLFLIYVAYLVLRREIEEPSTRARIAALYAVAGFAAVPLAWFAQRIWTSYHPTVFGAEPEGEVATPGVLPVFLLSLLVFTALFVWLERWRVRTLTIGARIEELSVAEEVPA